MAKNSRNDAMPLRTSPQTAAAIQRALALCQQGDVAQAESLCKMLLQHEPKNFDLLHLLGVIVLQQGQFEASAQFLNRALKLNPDFAQAHLNLGLAQFGLKRHKDALASFDRALKLQPGHTAALANRGDVLRELSRHKEALAAYDKALEREANAALFDNRGMALCDLGRFDEALASFDRALAVEPRNASFLSNRGNVLRELGRHEEALESCDLASAIQPGNALALNNRGLILYELWRLAEALDSFDRALAIAPDNAKAHNIRGAVLSELGLHEEALDSFNRALAIQPGHDGARLNRGNILRELGRSAEAAIDFEQLLRAETRFDHVRGYLLLCRLDCCDWKDYGRSEERLKSEIAAGKPASRPFPFLSTFSTPALQLQCARMVHANLVPPPALAEGAPYRHDRIRVAYVSADFHNHATAHLAAGLFEAHDRAAFEITAISHGPDARDDMRERLERSFDRFLDVRNRSDREIARMMREMEIDIAVDLKGYTRGNRHRLFTFRPAPIQVNYLGYPGTLGAGHMDYILADRVVIPEIEHEFFSEKVVYLPGSYQPNDSRRRIGERLPTRTEVGLPQTGFVFASFNNNYKITPPVFDIWMRLLGQVDGSVLWLLAQPAAVANLRQQAQARGVAPDRLVFAPNLGSEDHLARLRLADLFLDTLPLNAHTTASDALWAGLPVLTCSGESFGGRVAGSLLRAVGLPELIADRLEDYQALALKLARDPEALSAIRARLQENRGTSPLFDTDLYRRNLESAYRVMWERYQRGEPPVSFAVEAA